MMRLFRLALLIPPSTANVERGFSAMNLLCSSLHTSLNQQNLDRFMRISLTGPAPSLLKDSDYERYFKKFQGQPRRPIEKNLEQVFNKHVFTLMMLHFGRDGSRG